MYIVLFGKKHLIDHTSASRIFVNGLKIETVSPAQFDSIATGTAISPSAKLVKAPDGSMYLKNYNMLQIENEKALDNCKFDKNKLQDMSVADFVKYTLGDIIMAP